MNRPLDPRPRPGAMIVAPQPDAVEAGWSVLLPGDRQWMPSSPAR